MIDNARDFLDAIAGYTDPQSGSSRPSSSDRPVRLAVIDPAWTYGLPKVLFDGETLMGAKGYAWQALGGWDPNPGDRVFLVPVGTSYVIGGPIRTAPAFLREVALVLNAAAGWAYYDDKLGAYTYNPAVEKSLRFGFPRVTKSPAGWVICEGLVANTAAQPNGSIVTTLPVGFRPLAEVSFPAHNNSNTVASAVTVKTNGDVVISGTSAAGYLNLGSIAFNNVASPLALPLQNSWVNFGGTTTPAAYGKDIYGLCFTTGAIKSGTASLYGVVPVGYRPAAGRNAYGAQSTPNSMLGVNIDPAGNINVQAPSSTTRRDLDGFRWAESALDPSYLNMVYQTSSSFNAASYPPLSYHARPDGLVHVRGMVNAVAAGSVLSTLPAGLRPATSIMRNIDSGDTSQRLDINGSGQIVLQSVGAQWAAIDVLFAPEQ